MLIWCAIKPISYFNKSKNLSSDSNLRISHFSLHRLNKYEKRLSSVEFANLSTHSNNDSSLCNGLELCMYWLVVDVPLKTLWIQKNDKFIKLKKGQTLRIPNIKEYDNENFLFLFIFLYLYIEETIHKLHWQNYKP